MTTGISLLGQSLGQISNLKRQQVNLNELQMQLSTGKITQKFSGLESNAIISKRVRAEFNSIETYVNNIKIADRRIKQMTTSIEELQAQAGNIANIIASEVQEGEIDLERVHDLSDNILAFMEDLINTQDNERYVFGGAASTDKPLSSSTGTLATFMKGELADWQAQTLTTDQLISTYRNVSDTIVGYNAPLSNGDVRNTTVRADKNTEVNYTTLANDPAFKDIIVATQMMKELTTTDTSDVYHIEKIKLEESDFEGATLPSDLPQTPPPATALPMPPDFEDPAVYDDFKAENQERADNFFAVFNDLGRMLNDAIDGLDQKLYSLESDRAQLAEMKEQHNLDKANIEDTIDQVENVDINEVAIKLNYLQIQLEASYRATASVSNLSMVNFFGGAG